MPRLMINMNYTESRYRGKSLSLLSFWNKHTWDNLDTSKLIELEIPFCYSIIYFKINKYTLLIKKLSFPLLVVL